MIIVGLRKRQIESDQIGQFLKVAYMWYMITFSGGRINTAYF